MKLKSNILTSIIISLIFAIFVFAYICKMQLIDNNPCSMEKLNRENIIYCIDLRIKFSKNSLKNYLWRLPPDLNLDDNETKIINEAKRIINNEFMENENKQNENISGDK